MKGVFLYAVLFFLFMSGMSTLADVTNDMSAPNKIPLLRNTHTPVMSPGSTDYFNVSIKNRYTWINNQSVDILNITITLDIYHCVRPNGDVITDNSTFPHFSNGGTYYVYEIDSLKPNETYKISTKIHSYSYSHDGAYGIRTTLVFYANNKTFTMKSLGYFTNEELDNASYMGDYADTGFINITKLGVDGITPDMGFTLKYKMPIEPFYILSAGVFVFGFMGFYYLKKGI